MKLPFSLYRAVVWLHLPAGVLTLLLQRTPALRVVASAGEHVLNSRAGEMLRATFSVAALGATHSLAGATTFVQSPTNPVAGTVGVRLDVAFTYIGTPSSPSRFTVVGSLPPGMAFVPAPVNGIIMSGTPFITGTPTQAGTFSVFVQGFNPEGLTNSVRQPIVFIIAGGTAATAPTISAPPQNQSVLAGASVTFTVQATGSPPPTYQWIKNGGAIAGATTASLGLANVQAADAGTYAVVVSNSAGTVTSSAAALTVVPVGSGTAPAIITQPVAVTAAPGGTVAMTVVATGNPAPGYQWRRDGTALPTATDSTLLLPAVSAASAGAYSVVVNNGVGSTVTSSLATLEIANGTARLLNLSVRANLGAGATLIVGFATSAARSVLIRGVGPTLGAFGVPSVHADPRLELYNGASAVIGQNDDWAVALAPVFMSVGAFPLSIGSKDAALQAVGVAGAHSAHLKGPGSGVVLVELYDSGAGTAVRLINVSARNFVGTDDNILIAGFVVTGTVARTLLIRAVGPTLAAFGVAGTLADPKLEILSSAGLKLVENDNWSVTLSSTATSVGAFALVAGSRDAALAVTLPPGAYSAQVSGIARGTGEALIEVYEVP